MHSILYKNFFILFSFFLFNSMCSRMVPDSSESLYDGTMNRSEFLTDVVGIDEIKLRKHLQWADDGKIHLNPADFKKLWGFSKSDMKKYFFCENPKDFITLQLAWKNNRDAVRDLFDSFNIDFERKAALYEGILIHLTLAGLKKVAHQARNSVVRNRNKKFSFKIIFHDVLEPWHADVVALTAKRSNNKATFQTASTFWGFLEGGRARAQATFETSANNKGEKFGGIHTVRAQGEMISTVTPAAMIMRKYLMDIGVIFLLQAFQDADRGIKTRTGGREGFGIDLDLLPRYKNHDGDEDLVGSGLHYGIPVTNGFASYDAFTDLENLKVPRLKIPVMENGQVDSEKAQYINQIFCSGFNLRPVIESRLKQYRGFKASEDENAQSEIGKLCQMLLNASYDSALLWAYVANVLSQDMSHPLYLTLMGAGAFRNNLNWVAQALMRDEFKALFKTYPVDTIIVFRPDKLRAGAEVMRSPEIDGKFIKNMARLADDLNGSSIASDPDFEQAVEDYLNASYLFNAISENSKSTMNDKAKLPLLGKKASENRKILERLFDSAGFGSVDERIMMPKDKNPDAQDEDNNSNSKANPPQGAGAHGGVGGKQASNEIGNKLQKLERSLKNLTHYLRTAN